MSRPAMFLMCAAAALLWPSSTLFAAVVHYDVEEYVEKGQNYLGIEVTVEGRVAVSDKTMLKFRNCDVRFKFTSPRQALDRARTVIVTGQSKRETIDNKERTVFFVDAIQALPDDLDSFQKRELAIARNAGSKPWYELADWAQRRGKFYSDRELQARGESAFLRGIEIDRRAATGKPEALLGLVKRLGDRHLSPALQQSLTHEYCIRLREEAVKAAGPARLKLFELLLKEVETRLPESTRSMPSFSAKQMADYLANPIRVYDAADPATRLKLHRYLAVDLHETLILSNLAEDGSNGVDIARQIDKLIPERHALAEEQRERALARRADEVATLNQPQLMALVEEYRQRKDPEAANRVIEAWLRLKRRRLADDDLEGLIELAGQYRTLLKQEEQADQLLLEAWKKHDSSEELSTKLKERGYTLEEGAWLTAAQRDALPEASTDRALREGRIVVGLSSSQVRQMKGRPESVARSASHGQVNEVWTYRLTDGTRLVVQLTRFQFRGGEPAVVAVNALKTPER